MVVWEARMDERRPTCIVDLPCSLMSGFVGAKCLEKMGRLDVAMRCSDPC